MTAARRFLLGLVTAAVCLGLLLPMPASAANVYVTSINDNVAPLTADTMPVYSGGVMYVPYTVFDGAYSGIDLGIYASYSRSGNTVTLFMALSVVLMAILLVFVRPIVSIMSTPAEAVSGTTCGRCWSSTSPRVPAATI